MPIDRERFENADNLQEPPAGVKIVRFLRARADKAYRRREIAEAIDVNPETVGTNLTRLKARGVVAHREPYWALTDDRNRVREFLQDRSDTVPNDGNGTESEDGNDQTTTPDAVPQSGRDRPDAVDIETRDAATNELDTQPHREAAMAFFERVEDRLDGDIDALYLFGSVARATETADSDIDILAVVSNETDYTTVDDRLLDIAYDVQLAYGVRIEVHSIQADEFAARKARGDPFIRRIIEEGTVRD